MAPFFPDLKYTQGHFKAEEGILEMHQYPDLANHQAEHDRFTQAVLEFRCNFSANELGLAIEVMDFLKDWLSKHIQGVNKKLRSFECPGAALDGERGYPSISVQALPARPRRSTGLAARASRSRWFRVGLGAARISKPALEATDRR